MQRPRCSSSTFAHPFRQELSFGQPEALRSKDNIQQMHTARRHGSKKYATGTLSIRKEQVR